MYIIDGHNLIPKLPGGSLREIDDEEMLIQLLQTYARAKRRSMDVFFDNAPPGRAGVRRYGTINARFVAAGISADQAIQRYLDQLGARARNCIVVTSDRQVQANARARHAAVVTSEDFARELVNIQNVPPGFKAVQGKSPPVEPALSPKEVDGWLDLFGIDPAKADQPIEPEKRKVSGGKRKNKNR